MTTKVERQQAAKDHREKYLRMAKDRGITIPNLALFGITDIPELERMARQNSHLNNIGLGVFDNLTKYYNAQHPNKPMSLSDGCCLYKQLLLEIVAELSLDEFI